MAERGFSHLSEEYRTLRDVAATFVQREMLPLVAESERTKTFPAQLWPALGQAGLLGIGFPEQYGGSGDPDALAVAIISEELATASGGLAVTPTVSAYMAAGHLARLGTPAQQERYLPGIISGASIAAIGVTEPDAGSDVAGMRTRAKQVDGGWVINGSKIFISNGGLADVIVLAAKTDPAARHRGITLFAVERGDAGFSVGRAIDKMGWHSSDTRELIFQDCFLPTDRVLGEVGRGFYAIMEGFQLERIVLGGMGVGLARAALDEAARYTQERTAFGHALNGFQTVRHTLATMAAEVYTTRLLVHGAAAALDRHDPEAAEAVAVAKLVSAQVANRVADAAVQLHGGYGYAEETRASMHYRDARILRIGGGTDEIQLEIIAKLRGY